MSQPGLFSFLFLSSLLQLTLIWKMSFKRIINWKLSEAALHRYSGMYGVHPDCNVAGPIPMQKHGVLKRLLVILLHASTVQEP